MQLPLDEQTEGESPLIPKQLENWQLVPYFPGGHPKKNDDWLTEFCCMFLIGKSDKETNVGINLAE